jgi:putative intracellular protease/amidase
MSFNEQQPLRIGVVLFDGFESLDAFGPIEVFGTLTPKTKIVTLGQSPAFRPRGGPSVAVDYTFDQAPKLDLLIVPGGQGTRTLVNDQEFLDNLSALAASVPKVASVCTGSALLAKAGLLDGRKATSNKRSFQWVTTQSDKVHWVYESRWVDDGKYATSSGISAGIDLSLALVSKYFGIEQARKTAQQIEYVWNEDSTKDPFAAVNE